MLSYFCSQLVPSHSFMFICMTCPTILVSYLLVLYFSGDAPESSNFVSWVRPPPKKQAIQQNYIAPAPRYAQAFLVGAPWPTPLLLGFVCAKVPGQRHGFACKLPGHAKIIKCARLIYMLLDCGQLQIHLRPTLGWGPPAY